jgi:hypothetical protein
MNRIRPRTAKNALINETTLPTANKLMSSLLNRSRLL